ncbi:CBO0543 family protein [Bacillus sp. FJAT-27231]|uniref:CBO0543 family protein n=1 Tax=Bacillus sp. FJAT-27231 TaxID=1679168 RepID=UPI003FA45A2F
MLRKLPKFVFNFLGSDQKDWLFVFFIKSYYALLADKLVVNKDYVKYPSRVPKQVKTSVVFDYILFPISCVFYNQLIKDSHILQCLLKVL